MKSYSAKPDENEKKWYVVDLAEVPVGRVAAKVASVLRGKHRPEYTPNVDTGEYVIAINAEKIVFTGNKLAQKTYWRHTGYPGGIHGITAEKLLQKKPEDVFYFAVRGMLPKNPLGRQMLKKLKIYPGSEHPHQAQKPEPFNF